MSKHTPGPWRIEEGVHYACIRTNSGVIADMRFVGGAVRNMADARLIAAAPDLLEALTSLERISGIAAPHDDPARVTARAAIAKALGENNE